MEANELYCLSVSPVVENPFALEWSQDNHVSLITHRGVHIFELVPHPMGIYPTLQFWRTFVYPSEYLVADPFEKSLNNALCKIEREECCNLLAQSAITPKLEDRMDAEPVITRVAWSPVKLMETSKCLLAILTSLGSVEILHKLGKNWFSVWNLSSRWYETIKTEYDLDPENMNVNELEKKACSEEINALVCTAIVWSPLFEPREQEPCAYLVSAFGSGDLVIFRIERSSEISKAKEPTVVYKTKLESRGRVSEMLWVPLEEDRIVIFIGYVDGRIHGISLKLNNGTFRDDKFFKYYDHPDRIVISSIKLMDKISERRIVLVTKSCWLLVINVDANGECLKIRQLRLGTSFITGVITLSNERVMLTCRSSKMYVATIRGTDDIICEPVQSELKSKKVQYLGLARSRNATILVNVTSPDGMYDHLIHREPSTLQMFSVSGDEWNPWHIMNEKKEEASLYEYWDCLESIRVKAARSLDPAKELPEIPQNLECLSVHKLRIVMWLTLISQVLEKKQMLKGVEKIVGEISEAQPLIFLFSASEHLRRLITRPALTADERRCVSFLRMFMEIYIAGEEEEEVRNVDIWRGVNEALNLTAHLDSIETEACNICGEILADFPWRIERCPAGHKISRCSVTLLQITSMKYRVCPICGRMFHPSLDEIYQETRCLYCDVPARYDNRLISNTLGDIDPRWRNLSKRPTLILESKSHDNENLSVGEKSKRRSMNPQTFAVIVNRDDDDSYITETWQQF